MSVNPLMPSGLAADPTALNALKGAGNDKAALKEAAKQFEALFMRELLKSMREATSKSGLMDSEGENLGTDLLDQQFSVQLSGLPGGLASAIERQLGAQLAGQTPATPSMPAMPSTVERVSATGRQADFVEQHSAAAQAVARDTGIPAAFMLGQAGHESGWGRREINAKHHRTRADRDPPRAGDRRLLARPTFAAARPRGGYRLRSTGGSRGS